MLAPLSRLVSAGLMYCVYIGHRNVSLLNEHVGKIKNKHPNTDSTVMGPNCGTDPKRRNLYNDNIINIPIKLFPARESCTYSDP